MNRVDIARFEFDFDTTWAAFFTDSKLRIYSRYGGRDEHEPESRLSKASLLLTLNEVLTAHRSVAASIETNGSAIPNTPVWQPEPKSSKTPLDIPLLKSGHQGCVHCHQVREYSLLQAYHDDRFDRDLLFTFPLPESLGIQIDRSHGHRIGGILPNSPAENAGLRVGDVLIRCVDVPIRSELDLRWALHRLPKTAEQLSLQIERKANTSADTAPITSRFEVPLVLAADWRLSELTWRKSSRSVPADWGFRAAALAKFERRDAGLPETGLAIRILSTKPRGLAKAVGLEKGDVIVALEGDFRERSLDRLRSDILRRFAPGDSVQFTVRRGSDVVELKGCFPGWFTEETTVP